MAIAENVGNLHWNFQTVQGTPAAAGAYASYLSGGSTPGPMGEDAEFEETTSAQMRSSRYAVERHAEGAPEFIARPNVAASLLYGTLGSVSTAGASDPYTHTITPALTRPWMTFWRSQGALLFDESSDCKIDQLVISGNTGAPVTIAATVRGLKARHQAAAEATTTVETTLPFVFYHGDGALKVEGAAVASIGSFTTTITRAGEMIGGDGLLPIDLTEGLFTVSTQITQLFSAISQYKRKWYGAAAPANDTEMVSTILELGGTPAGLEFVFTAQATPLRSISLALPRVTVAPYEIPYGTGLSAVRETFTCDTLQPVAGAAMTAVVKNGMADLTP